MSQSAIYDSLQDKFPHYRKGDVLLIQGDCMDVMAMMPDKAVDLAVVDPPYFDAPQKLGYYGQDVSKTKVKRGNYQTIASWNVPDDEYFSLLINCSHNQIIWGYNYYSIMNIGTGRIIWDKKNDLSTFSKAEIAYCSLHDSVQMFRFMWNGMLQENMSDKQIRIHPTEKPIALYKWLYANYAKPNQLIFDSHGGSFSSAIAAHYSGVRFIGCELDEDYYRAAVERFKQSTSQVDMFA